MPSRTPAGVARRDRATAHTAVRHAVTTTPMDRLTVAYDAIRGAARAVARVAATRGDTVLAIRADRLVEDAATYQRGVAAQLLALRAQPPTRPRKGDSQ